MKVGGSFYFHYNLGGRKMKKICNGLLYNTETAICLYKECSDKCASNKRKVKRTAAWWRTRNRNYFYTYTEENENGETTLLSFLPKEEADIQSYLENRIPVDQYLLIFPETPDA